MSAPQRHEGQCRNKVRHRHRAAAERAVKSHARAARAKGKDVQPMRAYLCPLCAGYHVGKKDVGRPRPVDARPKFRCTDPFGGADEQPT